MPTWVNAAGPLTGDADSANWAGFTLRQLIGSAQISNTGMTYCRVTFEASSAQAFTISKAYIREAADAGDAVDFAGTPVQLLFSGSAGFALAAGASVVPDTAVFSIPASKNLVISMYVSGDSSHDDVRRKTTITGWDTYYHSATDDAATVDVTGYVLWNANSAQAVLRVEVASDSGMWLAM